MNRSTHLSTRHRALALLAASSLVLAGIDYLIPKPIPFLRLGLANLPIVVALTQFRLREILLLTFLKVFGHGLLTGMLFSYVFLFSAAGSFSAVFVMIALRKLGGKHISLVGVSVGGALASNSVQLLFAWQFVFGPGAVLIAPPFLGVGTLTSLIIGITAQKFVSESSWLRTISGAIPEAE